MIFFIISRLYFSIKQKPATNRTKNNSYYTYYLAASQRIGNHDHQQSIRHLAVIFHFPKKDDLCRFPPRSNSCLPVRRRFYWWMSPERICPNAMPFYWSPNNRMFRKRKSVRYQAVNRQSLEMAHPNTAGVEHNEVRCIVFHAVTVKKSRLSRSL